LGRVIENGPQGKPMIVDAFEHQLVNATCRQRSHEPGHLAPEAAVSHDREIGNASAERPHEWGDVPVVGIPCLDDGADRWARQCRERLFELGNARHGTELRATPDRIAQTSAHLEANGERQNERRLLGHRVLTE
jgi:hypothetical protein